MNHREKKNNILISNLHKNIILNFETGKCEHKYLSRINIQNKYDKWGYCYFFCNFYLFHILYFLHDVDKKYNIVPIHYWSNEIMEIIGKFAIFLGLYNKGINYAWGGAGPSKHYRTILFNLKKNLSKDIQPFLYLDCLNKL